MLSRYIGGSTCFSARGCSVSCMCTDTVGVCALVRMPEGPIVAQRHSNLIT
jgi:hypothetical protein